MVLAEIYRPGAVCEFTGGVSGISFRVVLADDDRDVVFSEGARLRQAGADFVIDALAALGRRHCLSSGDEDIRSNETNYGF